MTAKDFGPGLSLSKISFEVFCSPIRGRMAPKIHYIGIFDFAAEGKNLWEILCQLKGLGVGRYVTKTEWSLKWPDYPSYLKIVKVDCIVSP